MRALTVWQPFADLVIAGVKPVENRSWPPPSTLPQWYRCEDNLNPRYLPDRDGEGAARCCVPDGPFPFRLGIHAAKRADRDGLQALLDRYGTTSTIEEPAAGIVRSWLRWADAKWAGLDHPYDGRLGVLLGFVTVTGYHHADECQREYVCINGHRRDDRGRQLSGQFLSPLPKHRYAFECAEPGCEAEAEPERNLCSRWAQPGQYHWALADPEPLAEPIPMRGYQKLWTLPAEVTP